MTADETLPSRYAAPYEPEWVPDVLGKGFEQRTLELLPDEGGQVVATIVRAEKPSWAARSFGSAGDYDVLYLHGWSDYFFQSHVAGYWRERGAHFYALDLRGYGRSLREGQRPGFVTDLETYFEDIEAALTEMGHGAKQRATRKLILLGHSTGGLVLSLWAAQHEERVHALVLNSPWLELQTREIGRMALSPVIGTLSRLNPNTHVRNADPGFYVRTVSTRFQGEWEIDQLWRPDRSFPIYAAWLQAVLRGHERVASGLNLRVPVLVMLSARSTFSPVWEASMASTDTVLDVAGVARRALDLGSNVTVSRIDGAIHDVFLSPRPVRDQAFDQISQWLTGTGRRTPAAFGALLRWLRLVR